jgi:inosine-uridine nucleoside N-ribohydrolase
VSSFRETLVFVVVSVLILACASVGVAQEKVILDTDMVELFDDGVAMMMLAKHPDVELMGVTPVAGNTWVAEGTAYALRQLELIKATYIPVVPGARFPLRPLRYENITLEQQAFGESEYVGCLSRPEPSSYLDLGAAPYGRYPQAEPWDQHAVDFIINTVKENPGEVTILAIGPCTNLAMAIRQAPEIVPLVKRVVYMGASFDIPGNTTPAGEFNWYFDPEAARMCVTAPFADQLIVPLDVCEKVHFGKEQFDRITAVDSPIADMFKAIYGPEFDKDANWNTLVWDTIAAASVIDPTIDTVVESRWVDVNAEYGLSYGRSLSYKTQGPASTQKVRILFDINQDRFWDLVVGLLTAPIE